MGLLEAEVLGVLVAGTAHASGHGDVMECGDGAFVEALTLGEAGEGGPDAARAGEAALDRLCVPVAGGEVEPDPTGNVLVGPVQNDLPSLPPTDKRERPMAKPWTVAEVQRSISGIERDRLI
ncbi:hypothetical protein ABZX77_32285 [Streptomyces sp. NPDC004237]|uniref:hypothetical protein n=1 Tax=Streptomyces sp. NPDC004237 TaxID=3154455 RepID=UPI0033B82F5E